MTNYQRIEKVLHHLERNHRAQPRLADLARIAGVSPFHFHRLFSSWAGTTPKAFLKFLTAAHAKRLLRESRDVLDASLESGLSGPGRLHDLLVSVEAMSPGEYKARGAGLTIRYGFHETPFGPCLIGLTTRGICHVAFVTDGDRAASLSELREHFPLATLAKDARATAKTAAAIFAPRGRKRLSVSVGGTPFQLKVWEALLRIPPGQLVSYGELASAIGNPGAARAVGSAIAANSIAFLIPCHRVIRESGIIGDYRWGGARKKALLAWESATRRRD